VKVVVVVLCLPISSNFVVTIAKNSSDGGWSFGWLVGWLGRIEPKMWVVYKRPKWWGFNFGKEKSKRRHLCFLFFQLISLLLTNYRSRRTLLWSAPLIC